MGTCCTNAECGGLTCLDNHTCGCPTGKQMCGAGCIAADACCPPQVKCPQTGKCVAPGELATCCGMCAIEGQSCTAEGRCACPADKKVCGNRCIPREGCCDTCPGNQACVNNACVCPMDRQCGTQCCPQGQMCLSLPGPLPPHCGLPPPPP
jgi:hypothetical protein